MTIVSVENPEAHLWVARVLFSEGSQFFYFRQSLQPDEAQILAEAQALLDRMQVQ